ncbi:uncharacterized protein I206_106406 [Kwoniella pini CBS 10737]|uniref:RING-type domain-containing protein n=1 Tax=Kwoniella pini CBS 10737 TaxID=1296096 RepID=A0A1B9HU81_9TREE|nr:uncharacterized protein I206_07210 [Kwoniella pini CBS 10737]OCF46823.1 hypothetical protein I206_07210 [Kwoniella pini CBS 10737]
MNSGRTGATTGRRKDDPLESRGNTPAGGGRAKARKKPKVSPSPTPRSGPIPTPYLALAPTPISSLSSSTIDQLAATASSSNLILPSSFIRSSQHKRNKSTPNLREEGGNEEAGSSSNVNRNTSDVVYNRPMSGQGQTTRPQKYVTSLLSPPMIIPGGTSATPRIQGSGNTPQLPPNTRRRSSEQREQRELRERAANRRRSQERLRDLVNGNPSLTSLGQLGQILESGQLPEDNEDEHGLSRAQQDVQQAQRRRRRIVRGEGAGVARRLTVSSREEGRAIGLARGASMRRTNVWDDIPEAGEPPPPFPFPTSSSSRLPPSFATPTVIPSVPSQGASERPRSPPPTFEQAIGLSLSPAPVPDVRSDSTPSTPRASTSSRPTLSVSTSVPQVVIAEAENSPSSTHYASAPSSPTHTVLGFDDFRAAERLKSSERDDRRAWNEDLLAGYSLEERVRREIERQLGKDLHVRQPSQDVDAESETSTPQASPVEDVVDLAGPAEGHQDLAKEIAATVKATPSPTVDKLNVADQGKSEVSDLSIANTSQTSVEYEGLSAPTPESREVDESVVHFEADRDEVPPRRSIDEITTELMAEPARSPTPSQTPVAASPEEASHDQSEEQEAALETSKANEQATETLSNRTMPAGAPEEHQPVSTTVPPPEVEQGIPASPTVTTNIRKTPQRIKPTRSSTAESDHSHKPTLSPYIKRLSVPEFSPFKPVLQRPASLNNEPLFARQKQDGDSEVAHSPVLGANSALATDPIHQQTAMRNGDLDIKAKEGENLPPSREAALRRRNLAIAKTTVATQSALELSRPKTKVSFFPRDHKPVSGPLINFDTPTPSPPESALSVVENRKVMTTSNDISVLAASSAELLTLLELQDSPKLSEGSEPVAESSAQGAARMAKRPPPPPPPPNRKVKDEISRRVPPLLSPAKPSYQVDNHVSAENAAVKIAEGSPTHLDARSTEKPTLPPRRAPPPPPPVPRLNLIPKVPPPLPPRPTTTSPTPPTPPPQDAQSPKLTPRLSLSGQGSQNRPKGPRPPPPPPRARQTNWFSNFARKKPATSATITSVEADEAISPVRPNNERAQTDFPPLTQQSDDREEERDRIIERSSSAANVRTVNDSNSRSSESSTLRSPHSQQATLPLSDVGQSQTQIQTQSGLEIQSNGREEENRGREWTDLDLLVSRIDPIGGGGGGGERRQEGLMEIDSFEGYQRISDFLGPSKSQAASLNALSNLLTGLIQIDSRRTTPQGKIKLKLSLLGLRVSKCGICLSQFKLNERAIMLPMCNHSGHESCARRWFREKGNCWVCRELLPEE